MLIDQHDEQTHRVVLYIERSSKATPGPLLQTRSSLNLKSKGNNVKQW